MQAAHEPRLGKRVKRAVRYGLIRAALAFVGFLPARLASEVGERLGRAVYWLLRAERRKALASLERAFPAQSERWRRDMAQASFGHLGRCAFELACLRAIDQEMERWVEWPEGDRRCLDEVLARGKGVVFVSAHLGHWELLARRVSMAGYPFRTVAREASDGALSRLIERVRASGGLGCIWRGRPGAARAILRTLRAGEVLGLLIDQDTRVQSVFVPFFGELASTPRAAADLALRTGAGVVLGFCPRVGPNHYRVALAEVPVPTGEGASPSAVALTAELTLGIEAAIRRTPEQWVWMHERWKTRPAVLASGAT